MTRRRACLLLALLALPRVSGAQSEKRGLDIYFIDTEGGAATLIVTPQRESVLIDCGNPGERDAARIRRVAVEQARLSAIDHLVITHWHNDHFGGAAPLAALLPIRRFWDRGIPATLAGDLQNAGPLLSAYETEAKRGERRALQPGDTIPLRDLPDGTLRCLVGRRATLPRAPDVPFNARLGALEARPFDPSDNAQSLGFLLRFGPFRFLDLGDLTWNVEQQLVAPFDKIGPIDVYQVTHHGLASSNNPALVRTVRPRVAIVNNGPRKGGDPAVLETLRRESPDLQAVFQLHRNVREGAMNTDPARIANSGASAEACVGRFIKLSVAPGGASYTVTVEGGISQSFAVTPKETR